MRCKDDEKERRIREAVIEVVLKEGFGGASISKIAKCAGISPATVYTYYENKECMLQSIYLTCKEEMFADLLGAVDGLTDGDRIIETLIREYYSFMREHEMMFGFIESFGSSPALTCSCGQAGGMQRMMQLVETWRKDEIIRSYSAVNIFALLFHPVKMLAECSCTDETQKEELLTELIEIVQSALLV